MVGFLEPLVAWLSETKKVGREKATVTMIFLLGTLGLASVLSYSTFSEIQIIGHDLNGILDFLSSQITLPIGGLLIALFIGWRVGENTLRSELSDLSNANFVAWQLLIRYPLPIAIILILITGLQ